MVRLVRPALRTKRARRPPRPLTFLVGEPSTSDRRGFFTHVARNRRSRAPLIFGIFGLASVTLSPGGNERDRRSSGDNGGPGFQPGNDLSGHIGKARARSFAAASD